MHLLDEYKQASEYISRLSNERVELIFALKHLYDFSAMLDSGASLEAFSRAEAILRPHFGDIEPKYRNPGNNPDNLSE